jgi:hypothetical protein
MLYGTAPVPGPGKQGCLLCLLVQIPAVEDQLQHRAGASQDTQQPLAVAGGEQDETSAPTPELQQQVSRSVSAPHVGPGEDVL